MSIYWLINFRVSSPGTRNQLLVDKSFHTPLFGGVQPEYSCAAERHQQFILLGLLLTFGFLLCSRVVPCTLSGQHWKHHICTDTVIDQLNLPILHSYRSYPFLGPIGIHSEYSFTPQSLNLCWYMVTETRYIMEEIQSIWTRTMVGC